MLFGDRSVVLGVNQKEHVLNAVLLAVGVGAVLQPSYDRAMTVQIGVVFVPILLGTLLPDVDAHFGRHRKALHNLFVVGVVVAYPVYVANLEWVWVGVITHYVLDVLGTQRGIALFYPLWSREFGVPVGVHTASPWADVVTIAVTALEVGVLVGAATLARTPIVPQSIAI